MPLAILLCLMHVCLTEKILVINVKNAFQIPKRLVTLVVLLSSSLSPLFLFLFLLQRIRVFFYYQ